MMWKIGLCNKYIIQIGSLFVRTDFSDKSWRIEKKTVYKSSNDLMSD